MKKTVIIFCLHFLPFAFIYSQTEVEHSDCNSNIENILKVYDLKIRHETVQYIYDNKEKALFHYNCYSLNHYCEIITGRSLPLHLEKRDSSQSGKLVKVRWLSEEETNKYIEHLNCTPEQALHEYLDFIRNIKSEKEKYLKCIDAELFKGDLSEYAKKFITPYGFMPSGWSLMPRPTRLSESDYLKVFKEFILNDNEEILPEGMRIIAYLKCGCKIP
jgi:hypothetical protein